MSLGSSIRGREAELAAIDELLTVVSGSEEAVAIVQGGEGLGVTRVLEAARRQAAAAGVCVREATAAPGDRLVPLGQLVAAINEAEAPLGPEAGGGARPYEDRRYRLLRDIERRLRRLTEVSAVMVCLDDLHWADTGTVASLGYLVRELRDCPIFWVLGARDTDLSADLDAALASLHAEGATRLHLQPLTEDAARDLAYDLLGVSPGPELARLVQRCAGNPALIVALVDGLLDEGLVHYDARSADLLCPAIPLSVCEIARSRLLQLGPNALEVARGAAALGSTCTFAQLSVLTQISPAALLGPLDELSRCGLLTDGKAGITYREDVLREAVLQNLAAPARRAVQRQAADVLLSEGGEPAEVAARLIASVEDGHRDAAVSLVGAARRLGVIDPAAAASVGEHALRLVESSDPLHGTLAGETAVLLHTAGRHTEAHGLLAEALVHPMAPEQEGELLSYIAGASGLPAHVRTDAGRRALGLPDLTQALRSRLRASVLSGLCLSGQVAEATVVAEAVLADDIEGDWVAGQRPDDPARRSYALALFDHARGAYAAALERLDDAEHRASGHEDGELRTAIDLARIEGLSMTEAPSAALSVSAEGSARAGMTGRRVTSRLWDGLHGRQLLHAGRVEDAVAVLGRHFGAAADGGVRSIGDAAALTAFARAAAHLGATEDADAAVVQAEQALSDPSPEIRRHAAWLLACLVADPRRRAPLELPRFPAELDDPARMVRMCATGDSDLAECAVSVAEERHVQNPASGLVGASAQHARGLLEHDAAALERAAAAFDEGGRPLDAAGVLEDLAALQGPRHDLTERDALQAAWQRYTMTGATTDAARVQARLAVVGKGWSPGARGQRARWERLTPGERAVAELVAGGLSNREVADRLELSPHTVSDHLRRVFAKLEVHSRLRLIQIRHGPVV
jgi:DNA-binding CsgD family transcriptional regulator